MSCPLEVGERVQVSTKKATVRFVGSTRFAPGDWVGLELDDRVGKNDGSIQGVTYFKCPPNHGVFVRPAQCRSFGSLQPGDVAAITSAPPAPDVRSGHLPRALAPALGYSTAASRGDASNQDYSIAASRGDGSNEGMCVICLEHPANTAVVPCGHVCGCFTCLQNIHSSSDSECPICRATMTSILRSYNS